MDNGEKLWERVDQLRGKMPVRILAEKAGIGNNCLQSTRSLGHVPTLKILYPIAKVLNTTVDYLYSGDMPSDNFDAKLFQILSSRQELIDICTALIEADDKDIELIERVLHIEKNCASRANITA